MDCLPNGILQCIFRLLHLEDRMECLLVCRLWAKLLRCGTLYEDVDIRKDYKFENFISMMRGSSRSLQAKLVDRLILYDCIPDDFDTSLLPVLFSRVRVLILKPGVELPENDGFAEENHKMALQPQRLEHLMDFGQFDLTRKLLKLGPLPTLKTLQIVRSAPAYYARTLIPSLHNFPALTRLQMLDAFYTLTNVEDIHARLPLLENFEVSTLMIEAKPLPKDIKPAPSIKTLGVYLGDESDPKMNKNFFQYMRRKYPSLEHLTTFVQGLEYDAVYREFEAFLSQLGKTLKTLGAVIPSPRKDLFKTLDQCGCQIQHLGVGVYLNLNLLAASKQRNSIQTLSLYGIQSVSLKHLHTLKSLTKLELFLNQGQSLYGQPICPTLNLDELLGACPDTLKALYVQHADLKWNFLGNGKKYTSMKSLALISCVLGDDRIDEYITKRLPRLNTLTFEGNTFRSGNESLVFPKHHFIYLSVESVYSPHYVTAIVTTLDDHEQRFYSYERRAESSKDPSRRDPNDIYFYETIKPEPFEDVDIEHLVSITCASVTTLILDKKRALQ